ncbi:MAG: hypothetical protein JNK57_06870 [Planctomycetaceae bacterium]|nr:hypothetical protein [Planctomycetaceae bacterium]
MNGFESSESSRNVRVLDQVCVANPCPMSWDKMVGDDKVRFCSECQRQVWNFFEMTDAEIVEVLRANPERLCAKVCKSREGRLVTKEPHAARRRLRFSILAMMVFATLLAPLTLFAPAFYRWLFPIHEQPRTIIDSQDWMGYVAWPEELSGTEETSG